jgi:hypothetical protein
MPVPSTSAGVEQGPFWNPVPPHNPQPAAQPSRLPQPARRGLVWRFRTDAGDRPASAAVVTQRWTWEGRIVPKRWCRR